MKETDQRKTNTYSAIIKATQESFHNNGFKKTSISGICKKINISLGNFTYYFSTKEDVVSALYKNLYMRSCDFVNENINSAMNSFEKDIHVAFIYFYGLFCDEQTKEFHYEVLQRFSVSDYIGNSTKEMFIQNVKDFNLRLTEQQLDDIITADNGLSREVIMRYMENSQNRNIDDIISTLYIFRARLFTINEALTLEYIHEAKQFMKTHDHADIVLLV